MDDMDAKNACFQKSSHSPSDTCMVRTSVIVVMEDLDDSHMDDLIENVLETSEAYLLGSS